MSKRQVATINLQELAKAYHATDYRQYRQVMKEAGISNELESRLTKKYEEGRFARSIEFQQEEIEMLEKVLWTVRDKAEVCKKEHERAYQAIQTAQEELRIAQRNFKQISEELEARKQEKEEMEEILLQRYKKLEHMKKFILIHPTASLSAVDKKREGVLVCTKFDSERMNLRRFEDCIMEAVDIELDVPQEYKKRFACHKDWESAVEYVKLVVQFWLEDKPFEALYSSQAIQEMLDTVIKE